jgi:predicted Zn finger-like uncharacterized protein
MDVRCEQCGSEYELDDARVSTQGVSVKCTSCGNVFRVTATHKSPLAGEWMIRQSGGQVFKFKELTTLQRWIVERRVTRDDEISRTGETWKRLGDILELASFFQVAEQAAIVPQRRGELPGAETMSGRIVPVDRRRPASATPIIIVSAVLVGILGCAVIFRAPIEALLGRSDKAAASSAEVLKHIIAAEEALEKDTVPAYVTAERELEKALELQPNSSRALAGATFALAGVAEHARADAGEIDASLKAAAAGTVQFSPTDIATMATELGKRQAGAAARTERAFAYMKRTVEADTAAKDGLRAAVRYYALTNAQDAYKSIADKAQAVLADDAAYHYAVGMLFRSEPAQRAAAMGELEKTLALNPRHDGARFRLAELLAEAGDKKKAVALLEELLARTPEHSHASALKQKLLGPASSEAKAPETAPLPTPAQPGEKAEPAKAPGVETFDGLLTRANKARQADRARQAMDLYGRALELRPDNVEALTGLGLVYLDMEQAVNAIAYFQKAVAANSRYSDAYMGLAEAYKARGQKRDAVKNYQRYLELAPSGPEAPVAQRALKDLGQE